MARQFISIKQGDADTFTETITNLTSLSGYSAKMIISEEDGTEMDTIDGTINGLEITYDLKNETSKAWTPGTYNFETKIWDDSDHVYTPSEGIFVIEDTAEEDPS